MFAIAALATHLAVTRSETIPEARSKIDAIHGTSEFGVARYASVVCDPIRGAKRR
jgi:hypothetical protein